jgi:DNA-binding NtrC family response regulator
MAKATVERPEARTEVPAAARTLREMDVRPSDDGVLHLIVMGANLFSMHPLPESGVVNIGRDDTDDVRIDDPNASRHHARLYVGEKLEIEDLGSTNGTRLRGTLLAPNQRAAVLAGEAISIGWATLMIQKRRPVVRMRRLPTHAYFEGRLEEECERASATGGAFAVVRLHVPPGTPPEAAIDVVGSLLRPGDVLAAYGPDEYEMLVSEPHRARVEDIARQMVTRLAHRGVAARTGIAGYPGDARSADALIAKACERVQGREVAGPPSSEDIRCGPEMRRVYLLAKRAATANINVLIMGETGVGKEVMAETIHGLSPRAGKPFLQLNCAAISPTLLESELFGHEKSAFTGAHEAKPGLLETAEGGTVLLDEIGELPISLQAKLLRVIETRQVMRVGALKPRPIDVRFVAATNRDPELEIERGTFRQDLYFRLNGISLTIPPLRERTLEIPHLARMFLARARAEHSAQAKSIAPSTLALLEAYPWPGNVRELKNVIERGAVLCQGEELLPEHLPPKLVDTARSTTSPPPTRESTPPAAPISRATPSERQAILDALESCAGNQTRAAQLLGISRRTLVTRLDDFDIPRPRKR